MNSSTRTLIRRLPALASLAIALALAACSTVQETGRTRLMMVDSKSQTADSLAAFADMKKTEKISTNPAYNAQVQRVGTRIKDAVMRTHPVPDAQWEFVVFDTPEVNAFAMPGGKVAVYTGLLQLVASDDELAIVMGHEIAHVTSEHGAERASQAGLANTLGQVGGALLGMTKTSATTQSLLMSAYGVGAQGGLLAFSRTQESEADTVGMQFAATAGYNPQAAVTFWKKMAAASGQPAATGISATLQKLTSTHPLDADRIANLEKLVPQWMPTYEQARLQYK
jgi:predicted Zn-dependent protease